MKSTLIVILLLATLFSVNGIVYSALPPLTVPDGLGVNIHFAGRSQENVNKIADAGFKFIRMDFVWGAIETKKGQYNFQAYDELVDSLASKGIRVLFILDYGNGLYNSPNNTEDGRQAFAAFAKASVTHFKGKGVLWEIWNEPNRVLWGASPNPEDYIKLAKAVYPAIKEADPDSLVLGPAANRWDYDYLQTAFKLGLLNYIDVVSLHPYAPAQPEDAIKFYAKVRSFIRKYAPDKSNMPVISGEWGYNTSKWGISLDKQADYIARMFLTNMMCGCRVSIWYDWRNDGTSFTNGEHNYGVVNNDLTDKPAFIAMKTLSAELGGYTFNKRMPTLSSSDYCLLFNKGDDYRLAAWTTGAPHTISIPVDTGSATIISLKGEKKPVDIANRKFDLNLTGSVQYVESSTGNICWAYIEGKECAKETAHPRIDVLPPVNGSLFINVKRPSIDGVLEGKLVLRGAVGIRLAGNSIPVKIANGSDQAVVSVKMLEQPASFFSFSCSLVDRSGRHIIDVPTKRYRIMETFADGKPGDEVTKYTGKFETVTFPAWSDKTGKASGSAKLTYAKAPAGSLIDVCARLDYSLGGAKCSADILPSTSVKLNQLPQSMKLWIKSDGNDCALRSEIIDAYEEKYQPDYGLIDFKDWQCIEMDMTSTSGDHIGGTRDGRMDCPLTWSRLFVVDNIARNMSGSIYFGPVMLCYE